MTVKPQILSYRQQIVADHSSTNYLFYATKALSEENQAAVNKLSSHVAVGAHQAQITYDGEFADLDDKRRQKFLQYFDVEVRESYDWWDISITLDTSKLQEPDRLEQYVADSGESRLIIEKWEKQWCLQLQGIHLNYSSTYAALGRNLMGGLGKLGIKIRKELYAGKLDAVEVMSAFCNGEPLAEERKLSPAAEILLDLLEPI